MLMLSSKIHQVESTYDHHILQTVNNKYWYRQYGSQRLGTNVNCKFKK